MMYKSNELLHWFYVVQKGSSAFSGSEKFGCFLVMDPDNPTSVTCALRYWGCAIQAGAHVSGALGIASPHLNTESIERATKTFSPLPFAFIPHLSIGSALDWNTIVLNSMNGARDLLSPVSGSSMISPVKFDAAKKSVTLLMPGFDKSEIKLYQVCALFFFNYSFILKFVYSSGPFYLCYLDVHGDHSLNCSLAGKTM